jgi:hypothetical protein
MRINFARIFFFVCLMQLFVNVEIFPQKYKLPVNKLKAHSGENISRTMYLLGTSTKEHRNTVKILVYGVSISRQDWWLKIKEYLQMKYPYANLVMVNKAVGGFGLPVLARPAVYDIYSFNPDLIILHSYGGDKDYENFIREIRTRTSAEIAVFNDHFCPSQSRVWHDSMAFKLLPAICKKYKLELMDIRHPWVVYLKENQLSGDELLTDGTHLNDFGNFLMAELMKPYFEYHKKLQPDPFNLCKEIVVEKDIKPNHGKLKLTFTGNKLDLVANPDANPSDSAIILIDGKKPSSFEGSYYFTRPNDFPGKDWPWETGSIRMLTNRIPLLTEDWTLKITEADSALDHVSFDVYGSLTGFDGKGNNLDTFISRSGRIVIDPSDWFLKEPKKRNNIPIGKGFEMKWKTYSISTDVFKKPVISDLAIESTTVAIQGIPNKEHTLEIIYSNPRSKLLKSIKIYQPLLGRIHY